MLRVKSFRIQVFEGVVCIQTPTAGRRNTTATPRAFRDLTHDPGMPGNRLLTVQRHTGTYPTVQLSSVATVATTVRVQF